VLSGPGLREPCSLPRVAPGVAGRGLPTEGAVCCCFAPRPGLPTPPGERGGTPGCRGAAGCPGEPAPAPGPPAAPLRARSLPGPVAFVAVPSHCRAQRPARPASPAPQPRPSPVGLNDSSFEPCCCRAGLEADGTVNRWWKRRQLCALPSRCLAVFSQGLVNLQERSGRALPGLL